MRCRACVYSSFPPRLKPDVRILQAAEDASSLEAMRVLKAIHIMYRPWLATPTRSGWARGRHLLCFPPPSDSGPMDRHRKVRPAGGASGRPLRTRRGEGAVQCGGHTANGRCCGEFVRIYCFNLNLLAQIGKPHVFPFGTCCTSPVLRLDPGLIEDPRWISRRRHPQALRALALCIEIFGFGQQLINS